MSLKALLLLPGPDWWIHPRLSSESPVFFFCELGTPWILGAVCHLPLDLSLHETLLGKAVDEIFRHHPRGTG